MARVDYYDDPAAPAANSLVPAASAIVTDDQGRILLHRRTDNELWALPGGAMDIGETIRNTIVREVEEETGLRVEPAYIVGVYSDPKHVFAYTNGEVRQEFSICFACTILSGSPQRSDESTDLGFFTPEEAEQLPMHPSIRLRVHDFLAHRPQAVLR